jgi:hypothetical protein
MFDWSTIEVRERDSDSTDKVGGRVVVVVDEVGRVVVVVVVDEGGRVVVVVVVDTREVDVELGTDSMSIQRELTTSPTLEIGPKIRPRHRPPTWSGLIRNKKVYVRSKPEPLPVAVAPVHPEPSGHEAPTGHNRAPTPLTGNRPPESRTRTVQRTAFDPNESVKVNDEGE